MVQVWLQVSSHGSLLPPVVLIDACEVEEEDCRLPASPESHQRQERLSPSLMKLFGKSPHLGHMLGFWTLTLLFYWSNLPVTLGQAGRTAVLNSC